MKVKGSFSTGKGIKNMGISLSTASAIHRGTGQALFVAWPGIAQTVISCYFVHVLVACTKALNSVLTCVVLPPSLILVHISILC